MRAEITRPKQALSVVGAVDALGRLAFAGVAVDTVARVVSAAIVVGDAARVHAVAALAGKAAAAQRNRRLRTVARVRTGDER